MRRRGQAQCSVYTVQTQCKRSVCICITRAARRAATQALVCLLSTLHANCLSRAADKLGVMQATQGLFRARCGAPRFTLTGSLATKQVRSKSDAKNTAL